MLLVRDVSDSLGTTDLASALVFGITPMGLLEGGGGSDTHDGWATSTGTDRRTVVISTDGAGGAATLDERVTSTATDGEGVTVTTDQSGGTTSTDQRGVLVGAID